jgi:hypothetical protein
MQLPIPFCLLKGPDLVIELANAPTFQLWGKTKEVIGLPQEQAVLFTSEFASPVNA